MASSKYQGLPVHYSYATCGATDTWAEHVPDAGVIGCRCIGIDNSPGTIMVKFNGKDVEYPAEIGGECKAWDVGKNPDCQGAGAPSWCSSPPL